jgi:hypothetical protein
MAGQIDLFCVPQLAHARSFDADHNGAPGALATPALGHQRQTGAARPALSGTQV